MTFHIVVSSLIRSILYSAVLFLFQVIQDIRLVIRRCSGWWRGLFISRLSSKTATFSMHSPITMTEQWMRALSVSTHSHPPYVITQHIYWMLLPIQVLNRGRTTWVTCACLGGFGELQVCSCCQRCSLSAASRSWKDEPSIINIMEIRMEICCGNDHLSILKNHSLLQMVSKEGCWRSEISGGALKRVRWYKQCIFTDGCATRCTRGTVCISMVWTCVLTATWNTALILSAQYRWLVTKPNGHDSIFCLLSVQHDDQVPTRQFFPVHGPDLHYLSAQGGVWLQGEDRAAGEAVQYNTSQKKKTRWPQRSKKKHLFEVV